jgi:DNA (cytosine-5)-methyltransferase 1
MKCFSMFTGIGGFDLALRRLGHDIVGACEIDPHARSVFKKQFPGVQVHNDATNLHPQSLPHIDVLSAGFPCQAFSIAGRRRGFDDTRGSLFFEIARIAKEKRPSYLLLENVKGLLSHDKGETFRTIISTLDEVGYDAEWQLLNSKYFVPQNRERIFIIGHLRGERARQIFPLGDFNSESDKPKPKIVGVVNDKGNLREVCKQLV